MIELRTPKPRELNEIAKLWNRSFCNSLRRKAEKWDGWYGQCADKFVFVHNKGIAPHALERMHWLYVQERMRADYIIVASLDEGMAGFICFSLPVGDRRSLTVHYTYVLPEGRQNGIGSKLLEAARAYAPDTPVRTTHYTSDWARLTHEE
jgi:GNAT superfamily N-acetyltransferase